MPPEVPSLPSLRPPELNGGFGDKASSEVSEVTDNEARDFSKGAPSASSQQIKKSKNKDIRYVLKDGPYRIISSWENPLVEDPESMARGKGKIIDIYIEAKAGGSVSWWDERGSLRYSDGESGSGSNDGDDSDSSDYDDKKSDEVTSQIGSGKSSIKKEQKRKRPTGHRRSAELSGMYIHSSHLKHAIRSSITYYPAQILTGNFIAVDAPFKILWHCYHDLKKIVDESQTEGDPPQIREDVESEGKDVATRNYHITTLLDFLKPTYTKSIKPSEDRHREGVSSYDTIWLLLKPGCEVYAKSGGMLAGFILSSTKEDSTRFSNAQRGDDRWEYFWTIKAWCLTYTSGKFVRTSRSFRISKFEGEREITSLAIFPARFLDASDNFATRKRLEARGRKYFEYTQNVPLHLGYRGPAWDHRTNPGVWRKEPKLQYDGEIVIDPWAFQKYAAESPNLLGRGGIPPPPHPRSSRYYSSASETNSDDGELKRFEDESRWLDYANIDPKSRATLTPSHYFLIPRRVDGFALKQKRWMGFDIEGVKTLQWSPDETSAMNQLILPRRDIEIIKALSSRHAIGNDVKWGADFIPGKGEGQVFLLHGPPGTGKTYTVECVAEFTRRPLVCLTVADIGTDEVRMEANLSRWFTVAASWQAIILIDEADVFLERRQGANLQRNSLVSVFLRCMEYYPGMLFLTTNRIGQIDDAFLSRTSVALTYSPLSASVRIQIWDGFLSKLERERSDVIVTDRARTFLEEDEDMNCIPWNGREIRNALQTAIALAVYDSEQDAKRTGRKGAKIEVDKEHFSKVVQRKKTFIDYRDNIKRANEEQRALNEGNRALPKRA